MKRIILAVLVGVLVALPATPKTAIAAETSTSEKSTACNTDKARKLGKFWDYDPVEAYEFGLKIQQYVEKEDLQSLFDLVKGELTSGPRKKTIQGIIFSDVFSEKWREEVLSKKPSCGPIGWRGFAMAYNIWYQQNPETNEWEIFSIIGAKKIEASKYPIDGSWKQNGKLLSFGCFATIDLSGDNYEEYYDLYAKSKGVDLDKFIKNIGQYIGGIVPIKPIVPSWAKTVSDDRLSLAKKLSECLKNKKQTKIKMDDGWVAENRCYPEGYCLVQKYRLLKRISLHHCQALAPNFSKYCIELGLVQHSEETGGSMGNAVGEGIYGIINEPRTMKVYVMPLVNFSSLNDALNYVDQLGQ